MISLFGATGIIPVHGSETQGTETAVAAVSQNSLTVSGTVTDKDGEPIIGATVMVKGTGSGTTTDINGQFSLNVPARSKLKISYIGYKPYETGSIDSRKSLNVVMQEDNKVLDEVVVVGYGTMKRKEMTSAISHISAKDLNQVATTDASMLLQGKVSSVSVSNTNVGDPNTTGSIQVRGISSRSADLSPLIVVDGVPGGDIAAINPADIESIDVLKDGAASAIYGTRGSNGVILINLKKGARDGNLHTTYNGSLTVMKPKHELEMLTPDMWRKYRCKNNPLLDYGGNDNWLDAMMRTALQQMHTLSLSGGNTRSNYRVTVDYRKADGILRFNDREEYGLRAGINHATGSGHFFFSANVAPRITKQNNTGSGLLQAALVQNPTVPIYDETSPSGYYQIAPGSGAYNPMENGDIIDRHHEKKAIQWDATAGIDFFSFFKAPDPSWTFKTQITFSQNHWDFSMGNYTPSNYTELVYNSHKGEASRSFDRGREDNMEWVTNFSGTLWNDHHIRAMIGYSYNYGVSEGMSASNYNFDNDGLTFNNLGQGTGAAEIGNVSMGSYRNDHKLISFFGRINYDWKEKYLVSFSLRHEGSSRFGKNHKWGNFPAVSAGWRISEESFMKGISWLDDLKIRYDYGSTGNQGIGNYNSLATYASYGWYEYGGKQFHVWGPARNPNTELRWEKAHNQNIGIDFSVLNSRITGSLNYFNRKQSDLLGWYDVPMPPNLFNTIFTNVGTMRNIGFEFDITANPISTRNFNWSITVTGATNDNKFVNFSNDIFKGQKYYPTCSMSNPGNPGYLQRIEEGKRIGNFFTYRYAGVDSNGDWLVYNKENEVVPIASASEEDKAITGNGLPKFTGSMTHNFTYKDFDLSFSLRGAAGFQLYNVHEFYLGLQSMTSNLLRKAYEKNAQLTRASNVVMDYFIEDGDYLKIDNVTVGYTKRLRIKSLQSFRVYASFNNLYTFTKFSGVDPSTYNVNGLTPGSGDGGYGYTPSVFQFNFGVQLNF